MYNNDLRAWHRNLLWTPPGTQQHPGGAPLAPISGPQQQGGAALPHAHTLRRQPQHRDLRASAEAQRLFPPGVVPPPRWRELRTAIDAGNIVRLTRIVNTLRTEGRQYTSASMQPLLELAIRNHCDLQFKRILLTVPGVDAADLLDSAARLNDVALGRHILQLHGRRMLRSAIGADDAAAVFNLARHLGSHNTRFTSAEIAPLLGQVIAEGKSAGLKRALCELPGVRADALLNTAVRGGDTELVRQLLSKGANPALVQAATRHQAGLEMQQLLHAAEVINRLYPRDANGPLPVHGSRLDHALANYDLAAARLELEREKNGEALTDVELWQLHAGHAAARLDIKSAILALGDADTIDALIEATQEGSSILHGGMENLRDTHPDHYAFYKSMPYRSHKHNGFVQLNDGKTNIAGTEAPMVCVHFATKWIEDRIRNGNKFDYTQFADRNAIANSITADTLRVYESMIAHDRERHVVKTGDWGEFVSGQFERMAQAPRVQGERERSMHLLVASTSHDMAAELKMRYEADARTFYVVHFYDPNATVGDRRIAVHDPKDLKKYGMADMLPLRALESQYFGDSEGERIAMVHVIDPASLNQTAPAVSGKPLTSRVQVLSPALLLHLLKRGCAHDLAALTPHILDHLRTLSPEGQLEFLTAMNKEGDSGLFMALQEGHGDAAVAFCNLVLRSGLSAEATRLLLFATDRDDIAGLHLAHQAGRTDAVVKFCRAVLESDRLGDADKTRLLLAYDEDGDPPVVMSIAHRQGQTLGMYYRTVLESGVTPAVKSEILAGRDRSGMPMLHKEVVMGSADSARVFCDALRNSNLPNEYKMALFAARDAHGAPLLHAALRDANKDAIEDFGEVLRRSGLSRDDQIRLFACLEGDGSTKLAEFKPSADAVAAYRRTARSLGIDNEQAVMKVLNAWASSG